MKNLAIPELGTIISALALLVSVVGFVFGRGFLWNIATQSSLHFSIAQQLSTSNLSLNACMLQNDGSSNANDVVIHVTSEEKALFQAVSVESTEGPGGWDILEGGENHDFVRIRLDRLAPSLSISVIVMTEEPLTLLCQVTDSRGLVTQEPEWPFQLKIGDFALLMLVTILALYILHRSSMNNAMRILQERSFEKSNGQDT